MHEEITKKWLQSAAKNKEVAEDMYKLDHYNWTLFMWHLAIEKLLKAIIVKKNLDVPYIHDLWKLSKVAGVKFENSILVQPELDEITTFNLEARYEDYKFEFYKKATKEYTEKWVGICEKMYKHLEKQVE